MSSENRYAAVLEALLDASKAQDRQRFEALIEEMKNLAVEGIYGAAESVAESLAFSEHWCDPKQAYVWYHIHWALEGYSTAADPDPPDPYHYYGKVGDFRNEAAVSELIDEFGLELMADLDREARQILQSMPPSGHNSAQHRRPLNRPR